MATSTKTLDTAGKSFSDRKICCSPAVHTTRNPGQDVPDYTSDLAEAGIHFHQLGENLARICNGRIQHYQRFQSSEKLNKRLLKEKQQLQTQLSSVEREMGDKISAQDIEITNLKTKLAENALAIGRHETKEREFKTEIEELTNTNEQLRQDVHSIGIQLNQANSKYEKKVGQVNKLTDKNKLLKLEKARISDDLRAEKEYLNCLVEEQIEIQRRPTILNKLIYQHKWSSSGSGQAESSDKNNGNISQSLDSTRKRKHEESTLPENDASNAKRDRVGPSVSDANTRELCGERKATAQTETKDCDQRES